MQERAQPRKDERAQPRKDEGEGAYPRLQGRSQEQLAFVNNLLTTLALAVLAFAAGSSAEWTKLHELSWRRYLLGTALLLLAISLVAGIWLALNRLQSFRISARTARIRQLRGPLESSRSFELRRLRDQSEFLKDWSRSGLPSRRAERGEVKNRADELRRVIDADGRADKEIHGQARSQADPHIAPAKEVQPLDPARKGQPPKQDINDTATHLLDALRKWSEKADKLTWHLLYWQTFTFLAAAILLLIVPLSFYY